MRGLAWYSAILIGYYLIYFFIQIVTTEEARALNLWCLILFAPVMFFFIKHLRENK